MKVNKKFIDILSKKKIGRVGDIIKEMNFLQIEKRNIQNLPEHYKNLEQIFYTVFLLKKEGLVTSEYVNMNDRPTFNPTKFEKDKFLMDRFEHIDTLIRDYWDENLRITLKFYDFIDHRHKTEQQRDRKLNVWLPITVAILVATLTALLPYLFELLFH